MFVVWEQLVIHLFSSLLTSTCTKMLSLQNLITNSTAARENHYFVNLGVVHPCLCSYLPHKNILCAYAALSVFTVKTACRSHKNPTTCTLLSLLSRKKTPSVLIGYWFYWDGNKLYIVYNNKKKQCFYEQIHSFFTFQC